MASLLKMTTLLALVILGTQTDLVKSYPKVPSAPSQVKKTSARAVGLSETAGATAGAVSAEGIVEIVTRVDVQAILGLLQQIPSLRETVLQLVEQVGKLKEKDDSGAINEELEHLKFDVIHEFDEVKSDIKSALENNTNETFESLERIIKSTLDKRTNSSDTCSKSFLNETAQQIADTIIQDNMELTEKLINKNILPELSKITTTVDHNAQLLSDIVGLFHNQNGTSGFSSGDCDLSSAEAEIKTEIIAAKELVIKAHNEISTQIETWERTSTAFCEQRLDKLETLTADVLERISALTDLIKAMAAKQEVYFNSAVSEQTEIVQVVKRTHRIVKSQAETTSKAAAKLEEAAARTLTASRNLRCQQGEKSNDLDD